jgi:hypothetical protein
MCAAPAAAKPRADLVVRSVGSPPASLQPGGSFSLSEKVSNRGAKRAKASVVSYLLSRDRKLSADDVKIGQRRVPRLKRHRASGGTQSVVVPGDAAAGLYRLLACADAKGALKEKNERNNCLVARGRLRVLALQAPAVGAAPVALSVTQPTSHGTPSSGGVPPGGGGSTPPVTPPAEVCNGADDDGDLAIDEGVIPDWPHAHVTCFSDGPHLLGCDLGWYDLDGNPADGCEYDGPDNPGPETCNGLDDDADGQIDDGLVFPDVPHGVELCGQSGTIETICAPGWSDTDPNTPGCETQSLRARRR